MEQREVPAGAPREKAINPGATDADPKLQPEGDNSKHFARDSFIEYNNKVDAEYKLPVTGDRNAKWWYSAFHNATAMIGAGVLGLPQATAYLGWGGGITLMIVSWVISLYTLWQLVTVHEWQGKRFNRYHELCQYAVGRKLGLWMVIPFQLIVMVGLSIVYCVTGGRSMRAVYTGLCHAPCKPFGLSAWIVVFAALQLILSQSPNFNSLRVVSFLAALMSISYSTVAIAASIRAGQQPNVDYTLNSLSTKDAVLGVFNALGTIAFAYGGHNVALEIQATLPSPPASEKPMMRGVYLAYIVVAYCYFGVAFTGYWAFGIAVQDNVLLTPALQSNVPKGLILAADMFVVIHVIGSFQVYSMPVFDMIEGIMVKRRISNGLLSRIIYRSIYVILVAFLGITFPFFGSLLGFIGAFAFGPTTFTIPSLIYLLLVKPRPGSIHFLASWICLVFGLIITVLGSIGGMYGIVTDAASYKFYQ